MIKLEPFQVRAEQLARDLQAMSILTSGMQDTDDNKRATATFARVLAKNATSIANQLNAEADKLWKQKNSLELTTGQTQKAFQ